MIYCVRYEDVVATLNGLGFASIGIDEGAEAFVCDVRLFSIRLPNVNGDLPEIIVNNAFEAAGLVPPTWNTFWCD